MLTHGSFVIVTCIELHYNVTSVASESGSMVYYFHESIIPYGHSDFLCAIYSQSLTESQNQPTKCIYLMMNSVRSEKYVDNTYTTDV